MKVAVIGATGRVGGAVAAEAIGRGHQVTAISRHEGGGESRETIPAAARELLELLPEVGIRKLAVIGGGGSLLTPAGERLIDNPDFPAAYRAEAVAQAEALSILREAGTGAVDWTYLSPPPKNLFDGPRTGTYRVEAGDLPIQGADGESSISVADLAAATVDELERERFVGRRFTVGY